MTIANLVRQLLDAGASSAVIEIAIQALEEAQEEAQPARRRRAKVRVVAPRAA